MAAASGSPHDLSRLANTARAVRARVLRMSHDARAPHLGSSLSCIDILVAAYFAGMRIDPQRPEDADRDRVILSKGHAAAALYAVLAERGFFPPERLEAFNQEGGNLPEQPSPGALPGVEAATGSLGHGLPLGIGMALAGRLQRRDYRVLVVLSDGECNEGSVWEAALFAAARELEGLQVVIDYNRWQATGRSQQIMALDPLVDKWTAFGWSAREIDGHDFGQLVDALQSVPLEKSKPTAVVARTVKGKGVSFMEDDNNWHYRIPNDEELRAALDELA